MERLCQNDGRPFTPAYWNSFYCSPVCRQSARRKRDRERKQHIGVPEKEFHGQSQMLGRKAIQGDGPNGLKVPPVAKCRQCKKVKALRYDTYSHALDNKLDAEPIFCSASCVVEWWKGRPGERPDVSLDIARLLGTWNASEARARYDFDDDWDDYEYEIEADDLP